MDCRSNNQKTFFRDIFYNLTVKGYPWALFIIGFEENKIIGPRWGAKDRVGPRLNKHTLPRVFYKERESESQRDSDRKKERKKEIVTKKEEKRKKRRRIGKGRKRRDQRPSAQSFGASPPQCECFPLISIDSLFVIVFPYFPF